MHSRPSASEEPAGKLGHNELWPLLLGKFRSAHRLYRPAVKLCPGRFSLIYLKSTVLVVILGSLLFWSAPAYSLTWNVSVSAKVGDEFISVTGSVGLPDEGGSASFSSGNISITVNVSDDVFTVNGSGFGSEQGASCSGSGSGSGSIQTTEKGFSAQGPISGSVTCTLVYDETEYTETYSLTGSFSAAAAGVVIPQNRGWVSSMSGQVEVVSDGEPQVITGEMELREGMTIRTGEESSVTIVFPDGSKVQLNANSEFILESTNPEDRQFQLIVGKIKAYVKLLLSRRYSIRTPTATIGVRGTEFELEVQEDGSTIVMVLEGSVEMTDNHGNLSVVETGEQSEIIKPARLWGFVAAGTSGWDVNGERFLGWFYGKRAPWIYSYNLKTWAYTRLLVDAQGNLWPTDFDRQLEASAWTYILNMGEPAGMPINHIINAEKYLGWLYVEQLPWLYSYNIGTWFYLGAGDWNSNTAWVYILNSN